MIFLTCCHETVYEPYPRTECYVQIVMYFMQWSIFYLTRTMDTTKLLCKEKSIGIIKLISQDSNTKCPCC